MLALECLLALAAPAMTRGAPSDGWMVSVGGGIVSAPRSLGGSRQLVLPIPYIDARYKGRFFFTDNPYEGVGVLQHLGSILDLSASLGVDLDNRDSTQDPRVRGLNKVDPAAAARIRLEHAEDRWFSSATLTQRVTGRATGGATALAEFGLNPLITDRFLGSIGVSARVMDQQWAQTFLTVTAAEARTSGLPAHAASAGLLDTGVFAQGVYRIDDRWTLFSRLSESWLSTQAAVSPVVSQRGEPLVLVFLTRAF